MSNEVTGQLQRQLYGIAIYQEEIVLCDYTGDAERRFVVTLEQLMGFFRTGVTFRPFPGLVWMKDNGDRRDYLLTLPAGLRTILYRRKKKITAKSLRLPSLAVKVGLGSDGGSIRSIDLWGFTGRELRPDTVLYDLPLPNLRNASLCLGSTVRAAGDDIREAVERTIFDTPFNHHNDVVGRERLSFADYHRKYRGRCPLRTLNRLGHGRDILGGAR